MTISVLDWLENIVGKGENAGHQHFLLFPQCFRSFLLQSRERKQLFDLGLTNGSICIQ